MHFAPSNDAIDDIPSDVMKKIKTDKRLMFLSDDPEAPFLTAIHNRRASPEQLARAEMITDGMAKILLTGIFT